MSTTTEKIVSEELKEGGSGSATPRDVEVATIIVAAVDDKSECPEGGLHAWLAVLGSSLVYFVSFGLINSFGTFQEFYEQDYLSSHSATSIAFIGTLEITLLYIGGVFIGPLFDAFGLKYLYPIGCLGSVLALVALSFTKPEQIYQQFLSQGVLFGISVGFGAYPALALVGQYFKHKRALAMGIVAAASSVGGVCLPIMFSRLFNTIGFSWSVRVAALITLFCYLTAMMISRTRLPRKPMTKPSQFVDLGGFKDPLYVVLMIGAFLVNLGLYIPYYYIEPFAIQLGISEKVHPYLLPMLNGLSFFGRIIGGHFADIYGRMNVLVPTTLISGILCLALWLPSNGTVPVIIFACVYGLFSGAFISVCPATVGQISPTSKLGARIGTFFGVVAFATLIGTPIGGAFTAGAEGVEGYRRVAIFSGVILMAGSVALGVARVMASRELMHKV